MTITREETAVVANVGGDGGAPVPVVVTPPRAAVPYELTLSSCPKTLHVLWHEWEFGIGGRRAAKSFSKNDRGRVRYKFSLRKVFWDMVCKLIRVGYTSNTAIDKIYDVYSTSLSVTDILRQMRRDNKTGGHASLR